MAQKALNEQGVFPAIFGLAYIIAAIIILIILALVWTFWKPLFIFAIGVAILFFGFTTVPQMVKGKQGLKYVAITVTIGALVVLLSQLPIYYSLTPTEDLQATVPYCDLDPSNPNCICRTTPQGFDIPGHSMYGIFEEIPDLQITSNWFNMYCAGNGMMQQQQSALQIIKPGCTNSIEIRQYQQVPVAYCANCPAPTIVSDWHVRQCVGKTTVWERQLKASVFSPTVTNCEQADYIELKTEAGGPCAENFVITLNAVGLQPIDINPPLVSGSSSVIVLSALTIVGLGLVIMVILFYITKDKKQKGGLLLIAIVLGGIVVILVSGVVPAFSLYDQPYVNNVVVTPTKPFSAYITWYKEAQSPMRIRFENSAENSAIWSGNGGATAIIPYNTFISAGKTEKQILIVEKCALWCGKNCDMTVEEYQAYCMSSTFCGPGHRWSETSPLNVECREMCYQYQPNPNPYTWIQSQIVVPARRQTVVTFEAWVDSTNCVLAENVMIVAETFSAGRTITMQDFRYSPKAFCSQTQILVTEQGEVVGQKLEEYSILRNSYVTIPANQTWTFFYITDVTSDMPYICKPDSYDPETGECVASPGIMWSCSEGIYDPIEGLCTVQPDVRYACDIGSYDTVRAKCVYQCTQGPTCTCPAGSSIEVEGTIQRCIFDADFDAICGTGTYDPIEKVCEYIPQPIPTEDIWGTISVFFAGLWAYITGLLEW